MCDRVLTAVLLFRNQLDHIAGVDKPHQLETHTHREKNRALITPPCRQTDNETDRYGQADRYNSGGAGPELITAGDKTAVSVSGAERRSSLCCFFHQYKAIERLDLQ